MKLIFDYSKPGRSSVQFPSLNEESALCSIPPHLLRDEVALPEVSEVDLVRHYTQLSRLNFGVDNGLYPLGSCTMKYNPKINEKVAALSQFTQLHPMEKEVFSQGSLQVIHSVESQLCSITGFSAFTTIPAAGAHGELTAVLMIKKYFQNKGEHRDTLLIPDTAHGTNPASAAMAGFKTKEVPSTPEGDVDLEALSSLLDSSIAGLMLTCPNTLGLFDRHLSKVVEAVHANGSLLYCDGANLNALMGKARIADLGFDLMHINLHKTFSTPHGGGGPGSGPVGVTKHLEPFLPVPRVEKENGQFVLHTDRPLSIGRIHSFYGNFLVILKAFVYITLLGSEGIQEVTEDAVLNANYLRVQLKKFYHLPIDRICMHEFVLNDENLPNHITTNEIAKRLLDFGIHAPTIYFPLVIHGAMMFEPTETESLENLDYLVSVMEKIRKEIDENHELLQQAPLSTPVRKVDAVLAARKPVLTAKNN